MQTTIRETAAWIVAFTVWLPLVIFGAMFYVGTWAKVFILMVFLILIIALIILGIVLIEVTNQSSISGMLAQHYNVVSYLAALVIVAICFTTAGLQVEAMIVTEEPNCSTGVFTTSFPDIAAFIAANVAHGDLLVVTLYCWLPSLRSLASWAAIVSPLCSCGILVFPLVVHNRRFFVDAHPHHLHEARHFRAIGAGLISGWFVMFYQNYVGTDFAATVTLCICISSALSCVFFYVLSRLVDSRSVSGGVAAQVNRILVFLEFFGLFYYIGGLFWVSLWPGHIDVHVTKSY